MLPDVAGDFDSRSPTAPSSASARWWRPTWSPRGRRRPAGGRPARSRDAKAGRRAPASRVGRVQECPGPCHHGDDRARLRRLYVSLNAMAVVLFAFTAHDKAAAAGDPRADRNPWLRDRAAVAEAGPRPSARCTRTGLVIDAGFGYTAPNWPSESPSRSAPSCWRSWAALERTGERPQHRRSGSDCGRAGRLCLVDQRRGSLLGGEPQPAATVSGAYRRVQSPGSSEIPYVITALKATDSRPRSFTHASSSS